MRTTWREELGPFDDLLRESALADLAKADARTAIVHTAWASPLLEPGGKPQA